MARGKQSEMPSVCCSYSAFVYMLRSATRYALPSLCDSQSLLDWPSATVLQFVSGGYSSF